MDTAGTVIETVDISTLGSDPEGLAWDGKYFWVSENYNDKIYQIDASDDPSPDIKIDGQDGPISIPSTQAVSMTVSLDPKGMSGMAQDWWIIAQIARRLGFQGFDWMDAGAVFDEFCALMPIYQGLSWERISKGPGLNWPEPTPDQPGTPRLHEDGFPIGRGLFKLIEYRDPAEVISEEYPLWLTTGRRLQSYHTRTQTGRAAGIDYLLAEETLEVHPEDVKALGLSDGGFARVTSPRGSVRIKVRATPRSPKGTVFTSFAFSETPVNVLTGGGYDPVTHTAELKVCPVRVEPDREA